MPPLRRAILALWIVIALFGVILHVILRSSVLHSALELERAHMRDDVERVRLAITKIISRIGRSATDWGNWDAAYAFMADRNQRFVDTNLAAVTYVALDLDLIAFLDTAGNVAYAGYYDPQRQQVQLLADDTSIFPRSLRSVLTGGPGAPGRSGILCMDKRTLLFASRPVLTSLAEGPPRGTIVFGRVLDQGEVRNISEITRLDISIRRVRDAPLPADFRSALSAVTSTDSVHVVRRGGSVAGYGVMDGVLGNPALVIRVVSGRGIYQRGKALANYVLLALLVVNLAFGLATTALLWWIGRREVEFESHKRAFYRSTILAATDGKLIVTEAKDIERIAGPPIATWPLREPEDIGRVRADVRLAAQAEHMDESRLGSFLACTGEAVTNAVKHAGGGIASLHRGDGWLMLVVSDKGPGIQTAALPDVALRYGYTTAVSLGIGYKVIIALADKVYLATGPEGTVVGVRMDLREPATPPVPFPQLAEGG